MTTAWELIEADQLNGKVVDPFFTVANKGNAEKVKWLRESLPILQHQSYRRINTMMNNILWYTGEYAYLKDGMSALQLDNRGSPISKVPHYRLPFIINRLWSLTEQRVNRLSLYKSNFDTIPANEEQSDKANAKVFKILLDRFLRINNGDDFFTQAERIAAICAEAYLEVCKNNFMGDEDPESESKLTGEIQLKHKFPWFVFPERADVWEDVTYLVVMEETLSKEKVKKKYGVSAIKDEDFSRIFNFDCPLAVKDKNDIVIWKIYQKPCLYHPKGMTVTIGGGQVLQESKEYPHEHKDFPFVRLTDIDVPGRLTPMSTYSHLRPVQAKLNKLNTLFDKNISQCAHAKWLVTKGSCDKAALGNVNSIVEHRLGQEPKLVTFNSVSQDSFAFAQSLKEEMGFLAADTGVTRGTPPTGTRTAKQLAFFEEQEQKMASTQIKKHNTLIVRTLELAASEYKQHIIPKTNYLKKIVGKEYAHLLAFIGKEKLESRYSIIVQNSSAFSESKAARKEEVAFIRQQLPGLLTMQQEADILELGQPQKFYDIATAALRLAQAENELMLEGQIVAEPIKQDDHIVHWKEHMITIQGASFRRYPKRVQEYFLSHLRAHEMFMEEIAKINPMFRQSLMMLPLYPAVFTLEPMAPPMNEEMGVPMGAEAMPAQQGAVDPTQMPVVQ